MVEDSSARLDAVFQALADPTRRAMLHRLTEGEASISELAAPFHMSFAGASKHVKALETAGLVQRRVSGRTHLCRLSAEGLADAHDWLRFYKRFWNGRLGAFETLFERSEPARS
jgi:DNA-binding transcriptional ArsR family regulator